MTTHWAQPYIGIPWERGASGPDAYDCWGFTVEVQRRHFARELPAIEGRQFDVKKAARTIQSHEERENWIEEPMPLEGDLVLMARRLIPVHIGVWVHANGRGGVLHCLERAGVVFSSLHSLRAQGFGGVHYYHHRGAP